MQLKPSYAASYGDSSDHTIQAYTATGEERKKEFLRDGRTFFLAVAKLLKPSGFASLGVRSSPAGVAVSGDVYLRVWNDRLQRGVLLWLSATAWRVDRPDQLAIVANELSDRTTKGKGKQAHEDYKRGPNVWLSANLDSEALAEQLLKLIRVETICQTVTPIGQLMLFDDALPEPHYPELDLPMREGIPADRVVRIEIEGVPMFVRPQLERLLSGLEGWGAHETPLGLEATLRVHSITESCLGARIMVQNNWLATNGQLSNVSLHVGPSHDDLCEVMLGLDLWQDSHLMRRAHDGRLSGASSGPADALVENEVLLPAMQPFENEPFSAEPSLMDLDQVPT